MANILLMDEKAGVRQLLAEELAYRGYTVMTVGNVALVDEIIRFSNLDLVILDLYVKGEHRWDLLLNIKQQDPHLPVLVVTDFGSYRRDPRSTLAAGLLVKSFDLDDLLHKIAEIVQPKQAYLYGEAPDRRRILMSVPTQKQPRPEALSGSDRNAAMNLPSP